MDDATGEIATSPADGCRLSLIIPAWNEQETIQQAIHEAVAALTLLTGAYEVIVVDDGSTDGTAEIVRAEAAMNPCVRLLQQPCNRGYGAALRAGFQAAVMDLVAFTDADCQFDLSELEYLLPLARRYDVTCGYRIDRQDPARRRFFSWGYNTLVTVLMGSPVRDIDCALKVFRRAKLPAVLPECDNFFVNTEMLTKARQQGLTVVEVGVHHRPRAAGESKVSLAAIPRTLGALLPFWWSRVLFPGRARAAARWDGAAWRGLLALSLAAGALLFLDLSYPLIQPDEGRYVEISRTMLSGGDWVIPLLNGAPYYDKPPLFYWLTAASFGLLGVSEFAARCVPAGAAFLTVLLTYFFARRAVGQRAGFLAALILALTPAFIQCGRFIVLDSVFTLFVAAALFTAYEAVQGRKFHWGWWLGSAVGCALAVLTKGPAALVLLAPPTAAYAWLNRSPARPPRGAWAGFAGVLLALVAPWFAAVLVRDPGFARHFIIDHHLQRFFVGKYHDQPLWFYLPVLAAGGLPWSLLGIPFAAFLACRSRQVGLLRASALGFFVLWAGWCVLFFSLSRGKLPPYVLPALPALAILFGFYLEQVLFRTSLSALFDEARNRVPAWAVVVIASTWIVVGAFGCWTGLVAAAEYFVEAGLCAACIVGMARWGRRLRPTAAWAVCGLMVAAVVYESTHELVPAWSYQRSPFAPAASLLEDRDMAVAAYGMEWCSLPLHLGRDEIVSFTNRPRDDFRNFLGRHRRTLLVTKQSNDEDSLRWALPEGMAIRRFADDGASRIFLIQRANQAR